MKVGVIGLGSIGQRHAVNLKSLLGHEVTSYDPARGHKPERYHEIADESDAFVIASPTSEHARNIEFLNSRNKPIFVEKPIADHLNVILKNVAMVGYNLRFHSCVLQAKAWIDGGMIGNPLWGNFVCAEKKKEPRDHVVLNWSHEIDLALYLLGPLVTQAAVCNSGSMADITLHNHLSNCTATVHLDYVTEPNIRQSIVVGDKATIILDLISHHAWLRSREGGIIDHIEGQNWDQMYVDEIESFLARAQGKETVGCTGAEGLEVLKVCLAAQEKAA